MGAASVAGLIANGICLYLLSRHRRDDINMSTIWECSRNDIFVNSSVFLTAGLVYATRSAVPDLVVGFCLAGLLFRSSFTVVSSARSQLA